MCQKSMNAAKAVIWGNFVAINAFVEKRDIKSTANLIFKKIKLKAE